MTNGGKSGVVEIGSRLERGVDTGAPVGGTVERTKGNTIKGRAEQRGEKRR